MVPLPTVNAYIDGYNFYYSIDHRATLRLGWCDLYKLGERIATEAFGPMKLGAVKYYTATIQPELQTGSGEIERRKLWLEALRLGASGPVIIIEGYFAHDDVKARVEKQTDIKLAIAMVRDSLVPAEPFRRAGASANRSVPGFPVPPSGNRFVEHELDPPAPFDKAVLVSDDHDFIPAVQMVAREAGKDVAVFFPLGANGYASPGKGIQVKRIAKDTLTECRLPDVIRRSDGSVISWDSYLALKRDHFPD